MAPIAPSSRSAAPRRAATRTSFPSTSSTFSATKRDKRAIKHSLLLSKARASSDKPSGIRKRRRPGKKLAANISSIASALPELGEGGGESLAEGAAARNTPATRSLLSKRGVAKKREKVLVAERERFGKNLAVLTQSAPKASGGARKDTATDDAHAAPDARWAALRAHLNNTVGKG